MIYKSSEIEIEVYPEYGENCLRMSLRNNVRTLSSRLATYAFEKEFERSCAPDKYVLILDFQSMETIESKAWNELLETIKGQENRIEQVFFITDNPQIRAFAYLSTGLFSFKTEVFQSYQEIYSRWGSAALYDRWKVQNQVYIGA